MYVLQVDWKTEKRNKTKPEEINSDLVMKEKGTYIAHNVGLHNFNFALEHSI